MGVLGVCGLAPPPLRELAESDRSRVLTDSDRRRDSSCAASDALALRASRLPRLCSLASPLSEGLGPAPAPAAAAAAAAVFWSDGLCPA